MVLLEQWGAKPETEGWAASGEEKHLHSGDILPSRSLAGNEMRREWRLDGKGAVALEKTLVFRWEILDYLSCYGGGEDWVTSRGSMTEVAEEGKLLGSNQELGTCPEHPLPNSRRRDPPFLRQVERERGRVWVKIGLQND